jgi:hypothetical protein
VRSDLLIRGLYFKNPPVTRDTDGQSSGFSEKEGDDQKLDSLLGMGKVVAYLKFSHLGKRSRQSRLKYAAFCS